MAKKAQEGAIEVCPFCGSSWRKEAPAPHKEWLKTAINTALTTGVAAIVVLVLKLFGL